MVAAILGEWLPIGVIVPLLPVTMAVFVVSGMLLLPLAVPPTLRGVGTAIRRLFGVEGGIAMRDLGRRPNRTNLTIGILAVSIMVSFGYGNNMLNSVRDTQEWVHRISLLDYFVRGTMPDTGIMAAVTVPESLAEELRQIDEVERVSLMALLSGPKLLLLDEPLAGLDRTRAARTLHFLKRVLSTFDVHAIYVSHALSDTLFLCDEVWVLKDGSLATSGRPREVITHTGVLDEAGLYELENIFQAKSIADGDGNLCAYRIGDQKLIAAHTPSDGNERSI